MSGMTGTPTLWTHFHSEVARREKGSLGVMCSGKNQNSTIVEILDVSLALNSNIKLRVDNSSPKPKLRVDNQFCFKKVNLTEYSS